MCLVHVTYNVWPARTLADAESFHSTTCSRQFHDLCSQRYESPASAFPHFTRYRADLYVRNLTRYVIFQKMQLMLNSPFSGVSTNAPVFASSESVPFRHTPNLQNFVNPIGTEALLCLGIVAIAGALTKPEVRWIK